MSNIHDKYTYQMNPAAAAIALTNGKGWRTPVLEISRPDEEPKPSWRQRFLFNLGVKTMAEAEPTLKPFSFWNPTVVTTWCSVLALVFVLIGGLLMVTFYVGMQYRQSQYMEERLKKAEANEERRLLIEAAKQPQTGQGHEKEEHK